MRKTEKPRLRVVKGGLKDQVREAELKLEGKIESDERELGWAALFLALNGDSKDADRLMIAIRRREGDIDRMLRILGQIGERRHLDELEKMVQNNRNNTQLRKQIEDTIYAIKSRRRL